MENDESDVVAESQNGVEGLLQGPVHVLRIDEGRRLDEGMGLCLSGGGYRAMLFHSGVLWRLNEIGWLPKFKRISSVSGGSIAAGVLAMNWSSFTFIDGVAQDFESNVVIPLRKLADHTIDIPSVVKSLLLSGSPSDYIVAAYRKHLFGGQLLKDIPSRAPLFVINATSVQSGVLCRFTQHYMCDYRVGKVENKNIELAVAVAASSAFPPFLSPTTVRLSPTDFLPNSGSDLQEDRYRTDVVLSDGGVYDNLGLETVWKNYRTVLVSDAGGSFSPESAPRYNWFSHAYRTLETIDNQVRSLRKRQVVDSFKAKIRMGSYWSIRTDLARKYAVPEMLDCPFMNTTKLANIGTRLKRLDRATQEKLINWGYALTDAAVRKFVDTSVLPPKQFPYPLTGV
jgi:NTE family protein